MKNMKLDIMGISLTRRTESGKITTGNHTMIYSGDIEHKHGVDFILNKKVANTIFEQLSPSSTTAYIHLDEIKTK